MHRRTYLGLAAGAVAGLTGYSASALSGSNGNGEEASFGVCPDLLEADVTACPDRPTGPLSVDCSAESVSGDAWALSVTVTNRSAGSYGCNPHAWVIFQDTSAGWAPIGPAAHIEPWLELPPGDRYTWQISTMEEAVDRADQRVFVDLDPGSYAFAVAFRGPDRVATVAPFVVTA